MAGTVQPQGAKQLAFVGEIGLPPLDLAAAAYSECSIRLSVIELKRIEGGPTANAVAGPARCRKHHGTENQFKVKLDLAKTRDSTKGTAPIAFAVTSGLNASRRPM